jgi:hypothetical protein
MERKRTPLMEGIGMERKVFLASAALLALVLGQAATANGVISVNHITNGQFDPNEWNFPTVSKAVFPPAGVNGGSVLYVDQGVNPVNPNQRTLWLMYDWVGSEQPLLGQSNFPNSFFDVFFEVGTASYLIHEKPGPNNFQAFEKPHDLIAPIKPDGTFDLTSPVWTLLTPADPDLGLANFHSAVQFGTSPNSGAPHLLAEFDLSINGTVPGFGGHDGLYDPAPAFWSASGKNGQPGDPPISSAVFILHPDGTTTVIPILGPNGPVRQPQDIIPEPLSAGLSLLGLGTMALSGLARRRR